MPSCIIYLVMGFSYTYLMFQFCLPYCHYYCHMYMIPIHHHLSIINVLAVDVTGFSDKQHLSTVVVFQPT